MNTHQEYRKDQKLLSSLLSHHWDSAARPLKTQGYQKLIMQARPLGVFFILLLLHNPQESQTPVLYKSTEHNQICLKFLPQVRNINTTSVRGLFHEYTPFSMASVQVSHSKYA